MRSKYRFPVHDQIEIDYHDDNKSRQRISSKARILISGGSIPDAARRPVLWGRSVLESFSTEMPARQAEYRTGLAQREAIAEGIPCYMAVPGYIKPTGERFVIDESVPREAIVRMFEMRDELASINSIRAYLTEQGIRSGRRGHVGNPLSPSAVESMLRSPAYIGLVVFGDLAYRGEGVEVDNDEVDPVPVHEAIVDADLWHRVQSRKASSGRSAKSDRLLARQGVLFCKSCESRMTATNNRGFAFYRCQRSASPDCPARATVAAERVEEMVVARLQAERELMVLQGRASANLGEQLHQAARAAEADVEAAIVAFAGVKGLGAATRKIAELTEVWEAAKGEAESHERDEGARSALRQMDDWDRLPLEIRRGIVRATVARIEVAPTVSSGWAVWDERRVDVQLVSEG